MLKRMNSRNKERRRGIIISKIVVRKEFSILVEYYPLNQGPLADEHHRGALPRPAVPADPAHDRRRRRSSAGVGRGRQGADARLHQSHPQQPEIENAWYRTTNTHGYGRFFALSRTAAVLPYCNDGF